MRIPLLEVTGLKTYFPITGGLFGKAVGQVKAVDGVDLTIQKGEAFGLVGESGCGKTTLGRTILCLNQKTAGTVKFKGNDIYGLSKKDLQKIRPQMQYIFQDPYSSLNPRMRVGDAIAEPLLQHGLATPDTVRELVAESFELCGLTADQVDRFAHEFSGGQRQRVVIARAMALNPDFVVADEPVSALDVSIQAQIINLFSDLQEQRELSYLFISHDLSVVEHLCTTIAIMYLGTIVELASRDELFAHPLHPYTQALLSAIPVPDPTLKRQRIILSGDIPNPANPPSGCRFYPRCPRSGELCRQALPQLRSVATGHQIACHHF